MLWLCPGRIPWGAISANGSSTKRRRQARGWGSVNWEEDRTSRPKLMRSRSSGRGSFSACFGRRPKSRSHCCSVAKSVSGVWPARSARPTTAFRKEGEPGGQSTGAVSQRDDFRRGSSDRVWSRSIAARRIASESPRLEPRAMKARIFAGRSVGAMGSRRPSFQTEDILHIVKAGRLSCNPRGGAKRAIRERLAA